MVVDLNSVNGTFLNKQPLKKDEPIKLHIGDMIQFGKSSRLYICSKFTSHEEEAECSSACSDLDSGESSENNYYQPEDDINDDDADDDTEFDRTLKTPRKDATVHTKESLQKLIVELESSIKENELTLASLLEKKNQSLHHDADPLERYLYLLNKESAESDIASMEGKITQEQGQLSMARELFSIVEK
ncbi:hypothetical protein MDAP_000336 [Mitosporidium daphniae]